MSFFHTASLPRRLAGRWLRRLAFALVAGWAGLQVGLAFLPYDPALLEDHATGGPLRLEDRHGRLLYAQETDAAAPGPGGRPAGRPGRGRFVPLDEIAPEAVLVVLASEDRRFFEHQGVDPYGIFRAALLNLTRGRAAYGGSTITMQLARMVHSGGRPRSAWNKVREALLALRMERALSKPEILAHYLNRAFYGNGAYGIDAAARRYFGKPAAALSAGEATFLAIVPRAPTYYDPLRHRQRLLARRDHVLSLLLEGGKLTAAQVARIRAEPVRPRRHPAPFHAPHFVDFVLSALPEHARAKGGTLRTTLDLELQQALEARVREHVAGLAHRRVTQAGLVVLDTRTGDVLAMVGSADYHAPGRASRLNITTARRHPGSALKPFVYALALEKGDSPATVAYDVNALPGSAYRLLQVTQKERGPVPYREALAGSYNLAAVHVLERVGEASLLSRLRQAGLGPLAGTARDYGLQLTLGSARVRLVDLAAAYGFVARGGRVTRPRALLGRPRPDGSLARVDGRLRAEGDEALADAPEAPDAPDGPACGSASGSSAGSETGSTAGSRTGSRSRSAPGSTSGSDPGSRTGSEDPCASPSADPRRAPGAAEPKAGALGLSPLLRDHEVQLFPPEVAWLALDMLSDPEARRPMFGAELPFDLPFPVAAKTGTSQGFADTVAVAVTAEVTVAAWAGNFDGRPTHGVQAMQAAAPLVRAALLLVSTRLGRPLTLPRPPAGIVTAEVCPLSGLRPGPHCPHRRQDRFQSGHVPTATCSWHRADPHGRPGHVQVVYPPALHPWLRDRP